MQNSFRLPGLVSRRFVSALGCAIFAVALLPGTAQASFILQTAQTSIGNQIYSGVGVRFQVNSAVLVSQLGIFDSGQDGFSAPPGNPLAAYLFTDAGAVVALDTFDSVSEGTLIDDYRFKNITPVVLQPGIYVLAAYMLDDLINNCGNVLCDTFNNGGGALTFLDSVYGGGSDPAGTLPLNTNSVNLFSAGNMVYAADVPEPSTFLSLGAGMLLVILAARRRNRPIRSASHD